MALFAYVRYRKRHTGVVLYVGDKGESHTNIQGSFWLLPGTFWFIQGLFFFNMGTSSGFLNEKKSKYCTGQVQAR
jgi:hypothetical protein